MSFGKMVVSAISITGLFCPFFGVLFALAWSFYNQIDNQGDSSQSLAIYMGEAIGAAIGGLIFYYLFLPRFNSFTSAFIVSFFLLIVSITIFGSEFFLSKMLYKPLIWFLIAFFIFMGFYFRSEIDNKTRIWQWGTNIVAVYETAFNNIAITKKDEQISIFANGLWLFSSPDLYSSEYAVHPALLQHSDPKKIPL